MQIAYPKETIYRTLAVTAHLGHRITGRWKKVGLSFGNHCKDCNWPVIVTPGWPAWEHDTVHGDAFRMSCPVGKGA